MRALAPQPYLAIGGMGGRARQPALRTGIPDAGRSQTTPRFPASRAQRAATSANAPIAADWAKSISVKIAR